MKIIKLFLLGSICFLGNNRLLGMNSCNDQINDQMVAIEAVHELCNQLKDYNKAPSQRINWGLCSTYVIQSSLFAHQITNAITYNLINLEEMVGHLLKKFITLAQTKNESLAFYKTCKDHTTIEISPDLFNVYRNTSEIMNTLDACILSLFGEIHRIGFDRLGWSKATKKLIKQFIEIFTDKKKQHLKYV